MDSQAEQSGQNNLRWLSGKEYSARRSPTLIENPQAQLNEKDEVSRYLNSLEPTYLGQLKGISNQIAKPMSVNCRLSIGIPAYEEGMNIGKTLELYTKQIDKDGKSINPELFEITVFDNHPSYVSKDNTKEEVEKFRQAHPEVKIIYVYKQWEPQEPATVGNARKHLTDLTLLRSVQREQQKEELILASNDADTEKIDEHYVIEIIDAFDKNPKVDALTAKFNYPDWALQKPNLLAASRFWSFMARLVETGSVGNISERQKEPVGLVGRNAAMRSSIYAAVGGYNSLARNAEDLELGWLINDARNWDPQNIIYLNKAEIVSNPRRSLTAIATKTPVNEMYVDFHKHPEIRTMNNDQLLALIPDDLDLGQLEAETDSWWQSRTKGEYKYLGSRFEPVFRRAMRFLGLDFQVVNDHIKITSADKLMIGISKTFGRDVKVIPKSPSGDIDKPRNEEKINTYASGLTQGLIETRQAKATEYSNRITAVQQGSELIDGDKNRLEFLKKEYKRFTDEDYDSQKSVNSSDLEEKVKS